MIYTWLVSFDMDYKELRGQIVVEAPDMAAAVKTADARLKEICGCKHYITDVVNVKIGRWFHS